MSVAHINEIFICCFIYFGFYGVLFDKIFVIFAV